jgi:hypothetical protein
VIELNQVLQSDVLSLNQTLESQGVPPVLIVTPKPRVTSEE